MQIDEKVVDRIIHLKDSQGLGFRRIASQLKTEGLADMSKSKVAIVYNKYVTRIREETEKKLAKDTEWRLLAQKESELVAKVQDAKQKAEKREKIKQLALQLASTSYGRTQIFSHPRALLKWGQAVLENQRSTTLLDQLRKACEEDKIPFEKTLWEIVGGPHYPQYYESILRREGLPLDKFVREEVECYLHDREKEQIQKTLKKMFSKTLTNAKCPQCHEPIGRSLANFGFSDALAFLTIEGQLRCIHCGAPYQAVCPKCSQPLDYDGQTFWCKNCDLTFQLQDIEDLTRKSVNTARANISSRDRSK